MKLQHSTRVFQVEKSLVEWKEDSEVGSYRSITLADQVESFCIFNILADTINWY